MSQPASPPLDTMQRIELAEGVEVELHPAGPMVRAMAYLIDLLWMILLYLVVILVWAVLRQIIGDYAGGGALALLGFAAYWGYHVYFEAGRRAATPGKRAMGLRVVSESGGPASLGAVMLRNIARSADILPFGYFTGLLVCLFTRRFQRLGDLVARTLVVYASPTAMPLRKLPPPLPGVVPQPPPVTLTREERSAIVRFQERSALWSPARREELAAHAAGLTRANAARGVQQLTGMAVWLRDS
jgi:uncharacterized RDD family membrane protein YckC